MNSMPIISLQKDLKGELADLQASLPYTLLTHLNSSKSSGVPDRLGLLKAYLIRLR